ncbi:MAG: FAD-dependent thymidylate synthase [Rhodoferax sp.]|nr:FAD-dependent thymidylate synthase [Rhodoferax sp.]
MIYAKVIEDSISVPGARITTLELSYPRFIHGEIMTHRVFSRNAMSSRAIPVAKMIAQVRENPVIPLHWGVNQPGMQAKAEVPYGTMIEAIDIWRGAAHDAANRAQVLTGLGIHKQVVNRLLEPFQWMRTIVTATEWTNFFELRDHPDAEPHFQILAKEIRKAMEGSVPVKRPAELYVPRGWHFPYVSEKERAEQSILTLAKISAARCARVSYLTHDGQNPSLEADLALFDRLMGGKPWHASPVEHQAVALPHRECTSGNLVGWGQFRKLLEMEGADYA